MIILSKLIKTIFMTMLTLVGGVGAICILNAILQSFIDATEARRRITSIFSSIIMAMCAAAFIVILIQILLPVVNPAHYIDKLTSPAFYGFPIDLPTSNTMGF